MIETTQTATKTRKELMAELIELQYDFDHQDIVTFSAFLNDAELALHIDRNRETLARRAAKRPTH